LRVSLLGKCLRIILVKTSLTVSSRLSAKNVKLIRPTLFNYIATREELQTAAKELWNFIEKDGLNVKIHDVYPLSEIVRATEDIESRKTTGKLVLTP
jgi:NADPH2:quinone reductase